MKARVQFLMHSYDKELGRKDTLERKAQFYITFVGIFLTGVFLKLDYVSTIGALWPSKHRWTVELVVLFVSIAIIGLSLIVVVISALEVVRARIYVTEAPDNAGVILFDETDPIIKGHNAEEFLIRTAKLYAQALDGNAAETARKGRLLSISAGGLVCIMVGVILFIGSAAVVGPIQTGGPNVKAQEATGRTQATQGRVATP